MCGSQDWIYYHNIDLIFKKVIFFNLPAWWKDTASPTDDLFRLSNIDEFRKHHPYFDIQDRHVFAIDLAFDINNNYEKQTFFVVAANVFFELLNDPAGDGIVNYEDPMEDIDFLSKTNRVI